MTDTNVLLINMPWAPVNTPSIQLGLLKSCLREKQIESSVLYANLIFSLIIGNNLYDHIINDHSNNFFAEWLFNTPIVKKQDLKKDREIIDYFYRKNKALSRHLGKRYTHNYFSETFGADYEEKILALRHHVIPTYLDDLVNKYVLPEHDVVGFTCKLLQTVPALALAKMIREKYPEKLIVFGGAALRGDLGINYVKAFSWIDCVVLGEGEQSFPRIINNFRHNCFQDNKTVPNICFRHNKKVIVTETDTTFTDLNTNPIPDYSDYFMERKRAENKLDVIIPFIGIPFESSRGCSWGYTKGCRFCGLEKEHMRYRTKSADKMRDEVLQLSKTYKTLNFLATDLLLPNGMIKQFFPTMKQTAFDLAFFYETRATLSKADVKLLAEGGIHTMQIGIESFNGALLTLLNKGTSVLQNIQLLKWCSEFGIKAVYNILYRIPDEQEAYYYAMLDIMKLIVHLQPPKPLPIPVDIVRDSHYFMRQKEFNIRSVTPVNDYKILYPDIKPALLAYHYEGTFKHTISENYVKNLYQVINRWHQAYHDPAKPYLLYKKGPDFIEVIDKREKSVKTMQLEGVARDIFLYCDEVRSLAEIVAYVQEKHGMDTGEVTASIDRILAWFIKMRIVLHEDNNYLSLAINHDVWCNDNKI